MKEKISKLLDNVYELEGLIHLTLNRDDINGHLADLIVEKAREVGGQVEKCFKERPETMPPESNENSFDNTYEYVEEEETLPSEPEPLADKQTLYDADRQKRIVKPSYSINDRFLFIRELFKGNANEFNSSMESVAAMDSYEEAESYFLDELGLDENDDTVVRFLEIILSYFKTRT